MCNKKRVRKHSPEKKNLPYKSVEKSPRALLREILERYRWDIQICYIDRRFFNHTLVQYSTKKKKKKSFAQHIRGSRQFFPYTYYVARSTEFNRLGRNNLARITGESARETNDLSDRA